MNKIKQEGQFTHFDDYLIMIGIRSLEYTYTDEELFENKEFFKLCYKKHMGAYYALLMLNDYIKDPETFTF